MRYDPKIQCLSLVKLKTLNRHFAPNYHYKLGDQHGEAERSSKTQPLWNLEIRYAENNLLKRKTKELQESGGS